MFRKGRTQEVVCETNDPREHVDKSEGLFPPLDEWAPLPKDVRNAIKFDLLEGPPRLAAFWKARIYERQEDEKKRTEASHQWGECLSKERR